jgi:hypothetical protein
MRSVSPVRRHGYDEVVRHAEGMEDLRRRVLDGPGDTTPQLRRAAFDGSGLPDDLTAYVMKVREHAYKVNDSDIGDLKRAGYSEDQIFELTVAAALGAGYRRFEAGRKALER